MLSNEELGQELDRWQLIARDLVLELNGGFTILKGQPDWVVKVWEELAEMPEMRIEK